jgi:hypothetical protein
MGSGHFDKQISSNDFFQCQHHHLGHTIFFPFKKVKLKYGMNHLGCWFCSKFIQILEEIVVMFTVVYYSPLNHHKNSNDINKIEIS